MGVFFGIGTLVMGRPFGAFFKGFLFVFFIAVLAYAMEGQATMKHYGIGYAAWAIIFGMLISNTVGTPEWVKPAVQTEYYIKTGLVLLGAEILFGKILSIGIPGIFVAWVVTPIVLTVTFIFGQKVLKMPSKTLNITISADMSVCGVSAATVKMIQNVLIGVIAFFVALYWVAKVERIPGQAVSVMEIWYRFPKFVIGFIIASIVFSLLDGAFG